ncbi:ATP phosphoribosyltransferase regulatory subunit [Porticoccaceae bacterium LTM1]|nr:ATP phosphoribosyltransferase regulatory subunit [Porticoccaceae bacterium LTM1]
MTAVDRWLLPDGIEEILPQQAHEVERLRRRILDLYHRWGYDLVIPPLVEFTDSLLSGSGADLDLMTFKITDQLSGRQMGVRADITPQTARMDAHSLRRNGPNRLCYAGSVLYTRPRSALETRSPIQVGVELYGESSLSADIEVITLMVETLKLAGMERAHLDLGHVGVYQQLVEMADLNSQLEQELFELLQRKAVTELENWIDANIKDAALADMIRVFPHLAGDVDVIERARKELAAAPKEVQRALDEIEKVALEVQKRAPQLELYIDLSEIRGCRYHTGVVFAAFAPGHGQAIGNGGRYDHVGEAFGRSRPATGFSLDMKALARINSEDSYRPEGIYAPACDDDAQWSEIQKLRAQGERVVCGFPGQKPDFNELDCNRQLINSNGEFSVEFIS